MKKNTLDYINEIYTGGYKNALTYVNSVSPVIVEEPSEPGEEPDYLCFTATGESTIGLNNVGYNAPVLFYSTDKNNWVSWDYSTITLNDGESVYFYGENPDGFSKSDNVNSRFIMSGSIAASGNIQTLLSQNGDREDVTEYCYYFIFNNCSALTAAPELPATTLADNCYQSMFYKCSALTEAPELPATTLTDYCYSNMFYNCSALTEAPELPATTLDVYCYEKMFYKCSALTEAPKLPAPVAVSNCYERMFYGCTSLTVAPEIAAIFLASNCYLRMFERCKTLQSVTIHCVDWNTNNTLLWLPDTETSIGTTAENPTVYCPAESTIPSDNNSGIPTGWTRADL